MLLFGGMVSGWIFIFVYKMILYEKVNSGIIVSNLREIVLIEKL